jgi:CubicO group peptidase (beta-lactamase class C family)
VVGVIDADGRSRVVAYGDPGPGQPALDGNSVFEIGSITKVFTSTVLAALVQEGKVRLEDPAQKYLPAGVKLPTRGDKVITLGRLAEQNSGLRGCLETSSPPTRRTRTRTTRSSRCTTSCRAIS